MQGLLKKPQLSRPLTPFHHLHKARPADRPHTSYDSERGGDPCGGVDRPRVSYDANEVGIRPPGFLVGLESSLRGTLPCWTCPSRNALCDELREHHAATRGDALGCIGEVRDPTASCSPACSILTRPS